MSTNPLAAAASGDVIQQRYTVSIPPKTLDIVEVKKTLIMGRPISSYDLRALLKANQLKPIIL